MVEAGMVAEDQATAAVGVAEEEDAALVTAVAWAVVVLAASRVLATITELVRDTAPKVPSQKPPGLGCLLAISCQV